MDDLVNKEDCLPKGDAEESFVVISEGQVPSVEFNRREKEEGTGGPKESDEGSFDYNYCILLILSSAHLPYIHPNTHLKVLLRYTRTQSSGRKYGLWRGNIEVSDYYDRLTLHHCSCMLGNTERVTY